jgi:flavin reductase (DIM6/NTAB) family NADH-FMN oxidoreductase RutF/rubredoxin
MINFEALFNITYGLYIVCAGNKDNGNGFISNTFFQVTAEPARFASCCNKNNHTAALIQQMGAFSVSILPTDTSSEIFGNFGYKSGRDINKLEGLNLKWGDSGVPVVLNNCIAYLECKVIQTIDVGTHWLFIGELINAEVLDNTKEPMTYQYYRQVKKGLSPKNAPTYIDPSKLEIKPQNITMKRYKCLACGYVYDDAKEKISFENLPDTWVCPICGSEKTDFVEIN